MELNEKIEILGKMHIALEHIEKCIEFSSLIPEVRTNLVYSRKDPKTPEDVLGIEGRITVVDGLPKAAGRPKFGASSHLARLIIEIYKKNPSIRAGINFSNNPQLSKWLKEYCKNKDWVFSVIDRSREPKEIKEEEGLSMPWKVSEAIRAAGGKVPKLFYETGAVGKEPVSVLVGEEPIQVAIDMCEIAKKYKEEL